MKFKEIFKKTKNKKYCLTALLLAGLLIFAVLGGLNSSKSGKNQAYAATAPATKNLDLNGIRYTYQTSLKELKNNYGMFKTWYQNSFSIYEDGEGILNFYIGNSQLEAAYTADELINMNTLLKNNISIEYNNELIESNIDYEELQENTTTNTFFEFKNAPSQSDITGIKINYLNLLDIEHRVPYYQINDRPVISVLYVKNDLPNNTNIDKSNSVIYSYASTILLEEYYYKFNKINGYSVRAIWSNFNEQTGDGTDNQSITMYYPKNLNDNGLLNSFEECNLYIDNLNFDNINNNMISYNVLDYEFHSNSNGFRNRGNILLSSDKFDSNFLQVLSTSSGPVEQLFDGGIRLGGNFNENKRINAIYYDFYFKNTGLDGGPRVNTLSTNNNSLFQNNILWNYSRFENVNINSITYNNQNQLIYLPEIQTLSIEYNGTLYPALYLQVEDILYNVNYVGDIEDIEFNQKVEEDLNNLLKTVGLGAFVGLLIGLAFGNPLLGAAIGAAIGLAVAIIPLLIDGLQAIFGKQFLTGLYDFFKSIAEFFANFVDTIINFLMSIITNPFVLVFIVIAAIIFLIFYFKNK